MAAMVARWMILPHSSPAPPALKLDGHTVDDAPEDVVRQFSAVVLEALSARGLVDGPAELECWARPRSPMS